MDSYFKIEWLLFHAFQICIFQFFAASRLSKLTYFMVWNRNPKSASLVMPTNGQLHDKAWDYTFGVVSLLLLFSGYIIENKFIYWSGKYLSLYGFLLTVLVIDLYKYAKLKKLVPLEEIRSTTLVSRKVGRIIPLWSWVIYIIVSSLYIYSGESTKIRVISASSVLILLVVVFLTEKRSKLPISNLDDELYRKSEMITLTIIAWSFPIVGYFKSSLKFFGLDAIFSTIPLVCFIALLNSKIYKKIIDKSSST